MAIPFPGRTWRAYALPLSALAVFVLSYGPLTPVTGRALLDGVLLLAVFALAARIPQVCAAARRIGEWVGRLKIERRTWLILTGGMMLLLCSLVAWGIFGPLPVNPDGYAYYIQSRIFTGGHLYVPSHPLPRFFDSLWMVNDGKYYGKYPPGYPLFLAPFTLAGAAWLANPVCGVLCLFSIYFLTEELAGERDARLASLLALCSQLVVIMAAQYVSHGLAMACATGFALFYVRMHRHGRSADAVRAGAVMGFMLLVRPQVALPFSLPFAVHWLATARAPGRRFRQCSLWSAAAFLPFLLFFLYFNSETTGHAFTPGYLKFHHHIGMLVFLHWHNARQVARQYQLMIDTLLHFHYRLFLWPVSSLWFVCLLFVLRLQAAYCGLLAGAVVTVALSVILIPFTAGRPEGRYLSEMAGLCIALSSICMARLPGLALLKGDEAGIRPLLYAFLMLLFAAGFRCGLPDMYHEYRRMAQWNYNWEFNPPYRDTLADTVKTPALILFSAPYYLSGTVFNPPDDAAPVIAARDQPGRNGALIRLYPGRYIYRAGAETCTLVRLPLTGPEARKPPP